LIAKGILTMKTNCLMIGGIAAFAGILPVCQADLTLGSAGGFAVLGATTVTSTGNTALTGNLGVYPGGAITGFGPGVVTGTTHAGDTVAAQAQSDAHTAYTTLAGLTPGHSLSGQDLGGLILTPGIYDFATVAQLTGILTLNAEGNPNAQFIFQIGSTLTTASSSSVILENGANAGEVAWQVGSSATLGTDTAFAGYILADQSISLTTGASLSGSAVALNGAVTLDDNKISIVAVPEPDAGASAILCAAGLGLGWRLTRGRRVDA
jgi:hypothetical protein